MKICTGCGRSENEPLGLNKKGEPYLACCPDSNYVEPSPSPGEGAVIVEGVKDDFFESLFTGGKEEFQKINQSDFNQQSVKILERLGTEYSKAWASRPLKDDEFPDESICDKCTGCGTFKINDEEKECYQDREQGCCYHRFFDVEQFGIEVETEIENIYGLLGIEIVSDYPIPTPEDATGRGNDTNIN